MRFLKLLLILVLLTNSARADTFFKYGLGINNPFPDTATKLVSGGYTDRLSDVLPIDYQIEGGIFSDNNQPQGAIGFISGSVGLVTKDPGLYASVFIGPALMTSTDTRLASLFEFNNDLEVGIRDKRGLGIGINYKHFSNAGITQGNIGRDFATIKLTIPF